MDNSCQKTRKIRYYIFETLPNFIVSLYFLPNILSRIVDVNLVLFRKGSTAFLFSNSKRPAQKKNQYEKDHDYTSLPDTRRASLLLPNLVFIMAKLKQKARNGLG